MVGASLRLSLVLFAALPVVLLLGVAPACDSDDAYRDPSSAVDVRVLPPEADDGGRDATYYFSTPHTGAPSSLESCVNQEPTLECVLCPKGEICFTQLACSGNACAERSAAIPRGDDRCHRECATSNDCGPDEDCFHEPFTACTDYNGGPRGRGLCCPFGGCVED